MPSVVNIATIDTSLIHPAVRQAVYYVACDVSNPLYGPAGAAFIYALQKGADDAMVAELDKGLKNFAAAVKKSTGKDISYIPGAGAAGGLGAGLVAILDAKLKPGADIIIQATSLEEKINGCDLIITGEDQWTTRHFMEKVRHGVAILAKKYGIPVITINGSVNISYDLLEKEKIDLFDGNLMTAARASQCCAQNLAMLLLGTSIVFRRTLL